MKTRLIFACAFAVFLTTLLSLLVQPALAHRLDEYLQATTISIATGRVQAEMRLTPGVAVFPGVFAGMDTNGDGVLSAAEQQAYAQRVMGDLSLTLDGARLRPRLTAWKFGTIGDMKEGRGEIRLEFDAGVPSGSGSRQLVFENHHRSRIAVYLVNCLVPRDPNIQVTAQQRNYQQSRYELDYTQTGVSSSPPPAAARPIAWGGLGMAALLLFAPLALLWRRVRAEKDAGAQRGGVSTSETVSSAERRV